jgi:hypothetical protein
LEASQAPVRRKSRTVVLENELDFNYSKLRSSFELDLTPTSPQTNKKDCQLKPMSKDYRLKQMKKISHLRKETKQITD